MSRVTIYIFFLLIISCSKNSLVYEEIEETLLFSCIDYDKVTDSNFDSDDLYAFWYLFVEDAKCSMNNNKFQNISPVYFLYCYRRSSDRLLYTNYQFRHYYACSHFSIEQLTIKALIISLYFD